jgi:hypothetical protein
MSLLDFPSNFFKTFKSILKIFLLSKFKKLPHIELKNDEVVVLGNGPSLNKSIEDNLDFLNNKALFCVNYFAESEKYTVLKPEFYVLIDPGFYIDDIHDSIKIKRKKLFETINQKTTWKINLFMPFLSKKYKNNYSDLLKNNNINITYFNNIKLEGFKSFIFKFTKLHLGLPRPQNVLVPSLILTINIGFKKIYLTGADHDWIKNLIVNIENKVCTAHSHFYDTETKLEPVYLDGKAANTFELLETFAKMFRSYFLINEYSKKRNAKIINITPNSFIDAFEKQELKN